MGSMADGALSKNGKVYGVVPGFLAGSRTDTPWLDWFENCRGYAHSQASHDRGIGRCVTLPGGSGTYEELFETLTMKRLGQWLGPVIIVNTNGFYDGLLAFLRHSVDERFMGRSHLNMWSVVDEPEQVLEAIENCHGLG